MPIDVTKALKEALSKLTAEKRRIERQAAAVHEALRALNGASGGQRSSSARVVTSGAKRPPANESGRTEGRGPAHEGVLGEAERWDE